MTKCKRKNLKAVVPGPPMDLPDDYPTEQDARRAVATLLRYAGDNPDREGLQDTPARVVRAMDEIFAGYSLDPEAILSAHSETGGYDQMVVLKDIEFYSTCEHHMQPFHGVAHVAYLPKDKVVGISKLARLVDAYARRLQIQERLTHQIANTLHTVVKGYGVGVVLEARHFCMLCRGVRKQNSVFSTSALLGQFRDTDVRTEFLRLIGK
jgi:GTP cyclohydrolase I